MIPTKLFIYWTMILVVVIGGPIVVSMYVVYTYSANAYLIVVATIIPVVTIPITLTYIDWKMKRYLSERMEKYLLKRLENYKTT